ncbi:MAG: hypothetical protein FIA97_05075 [Methylococcaceae bacterium]|nr:hypothetical protein [Methylococcaceae bacterium]
MTSRFTDYPSLLEEIRKRPMMWFGGDERSITLLAAFLTGVCVAENFHHIPTTSCIGGFGWQDFEHWIARQFNQKMLTLDSFSLAKYKTGVEHEAFDLWYSWYDEYRSSHESPKS